MTYYPYEYVKDNKPMGFDIEYMKQVTKYMHREPVFMDTRFTNLIIGLRSGKYDIMSSSLYITPKRLEVIDMVPYLKSGQSILMRKDATEDLKTMADLCGKKVATMQGSYAVKQLKLANESTCKGKGDIQILEYPSAPESTSALFSHAADAQLTDAALSKGMIERMGDRLKVTSTEPLTPILNGIGIRKGDTEVKEALVSAMKEFEKTPEYQQLLDKYGFKRLTQEDIDTLMPKAP
ncbi:transporter substrate-binding domain-containing protein [Pokkaliibacter sp. CJK22405]|uniref:transporter substrate-binding domain-containing protein n=1 Tax=Pokkaliibacter sp. CJK22405 TaxID=3384615 RepID=UPI0039854AF5